MVFVARDNCPVCSSTDITLVLELPFTDIRIRSFVDAYYEGRVPEAVLAAGNYKIASCNRCGLIYQAEILDSEHMFELYENWISAEHSLDKKQYADTGLFKRYSSDIEGLASMVNKKPRDTRVLEFGSGWGYWARVAQAYGFDVTGIELSRARREYSQARCLNVFEKLDDLGEKKFDVIYSNQVFEHVDDPRDVLRQLVRFLADDGAIKISVPNGRDMLKKVSRSDWVASKDALHPLEHVNCFTRKSLSSLAGYEGLALVPAGVAWARCFDQGLVGGLKEIVYSRYFGTSVCMVKS